MNTTTDLARSPRAALVAKAYRLTAHVEAVTWAGLLVGMAFKYVLADNEIGVQIFGPIHGTAFLLYVASSLAAARAFGWSKWLLLGALVASIPPLVTWPYERYVSRRGALDLR